MISNDKIFVPLKGVEITPHLLQNLSKIKKIVRFHWHRLTVRGLNRENAESESVVDIRLWILNELSER